MSPPELRLVCLRIAACASMCLSLPLGALAEQPSDAPELTAAGSQLRCTRENTVLAKVIALEQVYIYNRFGAFNPGGMMYALRSDVVVSVDDTGPGEADASDAGVLVDGAPISHHFGEGDVADARLAGNVRLRPDKRPRPIVLRVNEGDCLKVVFTNLLSPDRDGEEHVTDPETGREISTDSDEPATRSASMHVNGLELFGSIASDGTNVGFNPSSLAAPGETRTYTWVALKEGGYLLYSMAAAAGGEGDGGQLGLGLFGSVNVEPRDSVWYRSQVTGQQLAAVSTGASVMGTPIVDYDATDEEGVPILGMLMPANDADAARELAHGDVNAIVVPNENGENCETVPGPGSACGESFREFTVIFHDEITAVQAFARLDDEDDPMSALKDGMGINYGSAGLGAMVLANRERKGPAKDCVECKLEEFFLTSWAMGDPALVIERDADNKAVQALYPDDPSNVHHSYLGDGVRFRNLHAGPKETHVFHLHAHQWLQDWHDADGVYLDSQTISPGASFTYEVHYGGSGNRNLTPGDSIFHCHLYPHFAQGMWELWRTHDVFEAGTRDRWLPDGEVAGGTPNPAVVPLPGRPLPPMPTAGFRGYPFYIAGIPGHRPPQAPLDIDPDVYAENPDQTLMRHVVLAGTRETSTEPFGLGPDGEATDLEKRYFDTTIPEDDPMGQSTRIASRVRAENGSEKLFGLAAKMTSAWIRRLPLDGTPEEHTAMEFHAGTGVGAVSISRSHYGVPEKGYPSCRSDGTCDTAADRVLFRVNGYAPKPGAPFADPCPSRFYVGGRDDDPDNPWDWAFLPPERRYRTTYLQFDMPVNKHGWHDPQARLITLEEDAAATLDHTRPAEPFFFRANSGECMVFEATNLMPSNLNLDDFQVFTPTDIVGQHIHLVKFDVTSSDGSGNGWNYEDGTFSPDEIRERIIANNAFKGTAELRPLTHRLFRADGALEGDTRGLCPATLPADPVEAEKALEDHPWCGAQSTIQRWWADPLLNQDGGDRTIRTVFTHDHFGPSSAQQHGFYAALVIEPNGSSWQTLAGRPFGGQDAAGAPFALRPDGGPTSFAANIVGPAGADGKPAWSRREYNIAVADFALLYTAPPENRPISPPGRLDHDLPQMVFNSVLPRPEGISISDPGGQLMNYRNEPVPGRVGRAGPDGMWSLKQFDFGDPSANAICRAAVARDEPSRLEACHVSGLSAEATTACEARVTGQLCDPSDLANVFSTRTHLGEDETIRQAIAADARPYDTRRIFMEQYLRRDCVDSADHNCTEPAGLRGDGDPATPILGAREGDSVLVRLVQGAQEENHIFFMNGAKWLAVPGAANSGWRAAQHIGISEHFEFEIDLENPSPQASVDQLYGTTATDNLWDGQWGLLRVVGQNETLPALAAAADQPRSGRADQRLVEHLCPERTAPRLRGRGLAHVRPWREAQLSRRARALRPERGDLRRGDRVAAGRGSAGRQSAAARLASQPRGVGRARPHRRRDCAARRIEGSRAADPAGQCRRLHPARPVQPDRCGAGRPDRSRVLELEHDAADRRRAEFQRRARLARGRPTRAAARVERARARRIGGRAQPPVARLSLRQFATVRGLWRHRAAGGRALRLGQPRDLFLVCRRLEETSRRGEGDADALRVRRRRPAELRRRYQGRLAWHDWCACHRARGRRLEDRLCEAPRRSAGGRRRPARLPRGGGDGDEARRQHVPRVRPALPERRQPALSRRAARQPAQRRRRGGFRPEGAELPDGAVLGPARRQPGRRSRVDDGLRLHERAVVQARARARRSGDAALHREGGLGDPVPPGRARRPSPQRRLHAFGP